MTVLESSPPTPATAARSGRWPARVAAVVSARRAGPLPLHILLAWPMALLPSLAFLGLAYGLAVALGIDTALLDKPPSRQGSLADFFGAVVFAPLAETLLLSALLVPLTGLSARPLFVAAASGLLWGCLHGTVALYWLFGTFWSFYVFTCSYLAWRPRGYWHAFAAAAVPHALLNLTAMTLVLFGA